MITWCFLVHCRRDYIMIESIYDFISNVDFLGLLLIIIGVILLLVAVIFGKKEKVSVQESNACIVTENFNIGNLNIINISFTNSEKKPFEMNVYILGNGYHWAYKSCNSVEHNGQIENLENLLSEYITIREVEQKLNTAKNIIAVGMSSQEVYNKEIEIAIAYKRASNLEYILKRHINNKNAIFHKLTLGYYVGNSKMTQNEALTFHQRPILIISMTMEENVDNLSDTLRRILPQIEEMPIKLSDYSNFYLGNLTFHHLTENERNILNREFNFTN